MGWWSKNRGKALGFLVGGPIGAMVGSNIDSQKAEGDATEKQMEYYDKALERSDPFYSKRGQFGTQLESLMKDPNAVMHTPYTQFQQQQGQQAIERSAAARGLLGSPQLAMELERYGQGLAAESFQNQFNNLAMLSGATVNPAGAANVLTGQGQAAAGGIRNQAQLNNQLFGNLSGLMMQAATMGMGGGAGMMAGGLGSLFGGSSGFTQPDVFMPGEQAGITSTIDPGGLFSMNTPAYNFGG